jgi:hypothetical protein
VPEPEVADVRALYQQRHPLIGAGAGMPQAILRALDRIRGYVLEPTDIHPIDNQLGFGHRKHLRCGGNGG